MICRPIAVQEYEPNAFLESRVKAFKLVLLTSSRNPNPDMLQRMYTVRVVLQGGH